MAAARLSQKRIKLVGSEDEVVKSRTYIRACYHMHVVVCSLFGAYEASDPDMLIAERSTSANPELLLAERSSSAREKQEQCMGLLCS